MSHHPSGISVEIVGLNESGRGRSCEQHATCGSVVELDEVLRLWTIQIINGKSYSMVCNDSTHAIVKYQ